MFIKASAAPCKNESAVYLSQKMRLRSGGSLGGWGKGKVVTASAAKWRRPSNSEAANLECRRVESVAARIPALGAECDFRHYAALR
jgi:hypothetical protein